jgi:hypothetical protein
MRQSFLVSQLLFSFLPLALFATFVISTVAFALGAAIIFALFWIGVALLLLVPTLFVTFSVGVLVWIWAVASFVVGKWIYNMVPVSVKGIARVDVPNGRRVVITKDEGGLHGMKEDLN